MLAQDDRGGFGVRNAAGQWIDAKPAKEILVAKAETCWHAGPNATTSLGHPRSGSGEGLVLQGHVNAELSRLAQHYAHLEHLNGHGIELVTGDFAFGGSRRAVGGRSCWGRCCYNPWGWLPADLAQQHYPHLARLEVGRTTGTGNRRVPGRALYARPGDEIVDDGGTAAVLRLLDAADAQP